MAAMEIRLSLKIMGLDGFLSSIVVLERVPCSGGTARTLRRVQNFTTTSE